jgi:Big-like domain-containing protein
MRGRVGGWSRFAVVAAGFMLAWIVPAAAARASVPGPTAANPDSVVTSEDTPVTFDPLDNDSATLIPGTVTVTAPLHGTAVDDPATGKITYTPAPHYNGPDSFSYRACDAANVCPSAGVSVDVRLFGRYRMVIGSLNADGTSTFGTMWPDASGQRPLMTAIGTAVADWAVLSPDGRKLATATGGTITVSFLDGSAPDQTATVCCRIERPEWSPGSSQLTFEADAPNPDPNFPGSFVNAIWSRPGPRTGRRSPTSSKIPRPVTTSSGR